MLSCLFLFLFISTVHCFPFFHIQKPFGCYPSVQLDIDTSQRILSNDNNITPDYGYVYSLDTPTHIKADIPVKDPSSGKEENATLVLTRIGYSSNSIHLFGRPSESNLHHFQSISVIKSIRFGIGISAPKWFRRMNARGISTRLVSKHIHGPDVQLVLAPTGWKNEHIELEMGAIKRRLVWSGQNKLPCKKKMHDRFDEMMDSAILF